MAALFLRTPTVCSSELWLKVFLLSTLLAPGKLVQAKHAVSCLFRHYLLLLHGSLAFRTLGGTCTAELPVILQRREADEMPLAYCSGEDISIFNTGHLQSTWAVQVANNPESFAAPGCQDLCICLGASLSAKTSDAAVIPYVLAQTGVPAA